MEQNNRYDHYTQLLEKVDLMFHGVQKRHADKFSCQRGCYGCCKPSLTVSFVEASRIAEWLKLNPAVLNRIQHRIAMLDDPDFCRMLDRDSACAIYEVRPLICRSHGLPVSWSEDDSVDGAKESRDVCPLNFDGFNLDDLSPQDVLSLDKINVLLSLINRAFDEERCDERVPLEHLVNMP